MRAWKNSSFHESSLGYRRRICIIFDIRTYIDSFPRVTGIWLLLPPERGKKEEKLGKSP